MRGRKTRFHNMSFPENLCEAIYEDGQLPARPEWRASRIPTWEEVQPALEDLSDQEKNILLMRFQEKMTLRKVSEVLHISDERVRQKQNRAICKLRKILFPIQRPKSSRDKTFFPEGCISLTDQILISQALGLNECKIKLLNDAGYVYVSDLGAHTTNDLLRIRGLNLCGIEMIKQELAWYRKMSCLRGADALLAHVLSSVPGRILNALHRAGYAYVSDLAHVTPKKIAMNANIGSKSADRVVELLLAKFKMEENKNDQ